MATSKQRQDAGIGSPYTALPSNSQFLSHRRFWRGITIVKGLGWSWGWWLGSRYEGAQVVSISHASIGVTGEGCGGSSRAKDSTGGRGRGILLGLCEWLPDLEWGTYLELPLIAFEVYSVSKGSETFPDILGHRRVDLSIETIHWTRRLEVDVTGELHRGGPDGHFQRELHHCIKDCNSS
jgi:hypothetical protein